MMVIFYLMVKFLIVQQLIYQEVLIISNNLFINQPLELRLI